MPFPSVDSWILIIHSLYLYCYFHKVSADMSSGLLQDVVRSSVKVPEFNKHQKNDGGLIGRNVVEITIKMKTIVRKPLIIKINKLRLGNLDNLTLEVVRKVFANIYNLWRYFVNYWNSSGVLMSLGFLLFFTHKYVRWGSQLYRRLTKSCFVLDTLLILITSHWLNE